MNVTKVKILGIELEFQKWLLVIAIFSFVIYANAVRNDYNLDDNLVTINHPKTSRGLEAIYQICTSPYYEDAAGNKYGYRPGVLVSFAIEHAFFGQSPHISHAINVFIYAGLVYVLGLVLNLVIRDKQQLVLMSVLIFSCMPIHSEVVNSIKNRDELLALLFALLSALAFSRAVQNRNFLYVILLLISAVVSVSSKKSIIPIVLIYPLIFLVLNNRKLRFFDCLVLITWAFPVFYFAFDFEIIRTICATLLLLMLFPFGSKLKDWFVHRVNFTNFKIFYISAVFVVGIIFLIIGTHQKSEILPPQKREFSEGVDKGFREGRNLTYIENPLVENYDLEHRISLGVFTTAKYIQLCYLPIHLSFYYGFAETIPITFFSFEFWIAYIVLAALLFLIISRFYYSKEAWIALLWYFGFIFLFSNTPVLVAGVIGERLAFVASIGLAIFLAIVFLAMKKKYFWFVAPYLLFCVVFTIHRNSLWENDYKLMTHDVVYHPESAQANNLAGISCMKRFFDSNVKLSSFQRKKLLLEAKNYFQKSIETYRFFFNTHFDLGRVYLELEDYSAAELAFSDALAVDSSNELAIEERVRAAYLAKHYQNVLVYLGAIERNEFSELILEIAAHTNLLTGNKERARNYCESGLSSYPSNNNFKLIWRELEVN